MGKGCQEKTQSMVGPPLGPFTGENTKEAIKATVNLEKLTGESYCRRKRETNSKNKQRSSGEGEGRAPEYIPQPCFQNRPFIDTLRFLMEIFELYLIEFSAKIYP